MSSFGEIAPAEEMVNTYGLVGCGEGVVVPPPPPHAASPTPNVSTTVTARQAGNVMTGSHYRRFRDVYRTTMLPRRFGSPSFK